MTKDKITMFEQPHGFNGSVPETTPLPIEDISSIPLDLLNVYGLIETVTTAPSAAPTKLFDQIKLYTDSLTSPTVYKVYFYIVGVNVWKSVSLS